MSAECNWETTEIVQNVSLLGGLKCKWISRRKVILQLEAARAYKGGCAPCSVITALALILIFLQKLSNSINDFPTCKILWPFHTTFHKFTSLLITGQKQQSVLQRCMLRRRPRKTLDHYQNLIESGQHECRLLICFCCLEMHEHTLQIFGGKFPVFVLSFWTWNLKLEALHKKPFSLVVFGQQAPTLFSNQHISHVGFSEGQNVLPFRFSCGFKTPLAEWITNY